MFNVVNFNNLKKKVSQSKNPQYTIQGWYRLAYRMFLPEHLEL